MAEPELRTSPKPAAVRRPGRPVRINLIGNMRMTAPGGTDILPTGRKLRGLLAYVCYMRGARVPRSSLLELLWDHSERTQGQYSLRKAIEELRRTVGNARPDLIEIGRLELRLNPNAARLDVISSPMRGGRLFEGLDGLSAAFDHWAATERTAFDGFRRVRLETRVDELRANRAPPRSRVAAAAALIAFDPTHEPALRDLMTALGELGDRARIIREYERCGRALRELGIVSSAETDALYRSIVAAMPSSNGMAVAAPTGEPAPRPAEVFVRTATRRPRVAVLPFHSLALTGEPGVTGEAVAEDILRLMVKTPDVSTVSRLLTFGTAPTGHAQHEVGRAFDAEYVLSGSIRETDGRLWLTAELADGRSGLALWSLRCDEPAKRPAEALGRAAEHILRDMLPRIDGAELDRAQRKSAEEREAYDFFLCARADMHNFSRSVFDGAGALFDRALEADPRYADALGWRAYWHLLRVGQGWSPDPALDMNEADRFARRAVECEPLNPMALAIKGHVAAYLRQDFATASYALEAALRIDENLSLAWLWSAAAHAYTGRSAQAVQEIERAMRLSPHDRLMYAFTSIASLAYLGVQRTDRALSYARRSVGDNPNYTTGLKLLIASAVEADHVPEAEAAAHRLLELEPSFSVDRFRRFSPTTASPVGNIFCRSLSRAGIPLG